MGKQATVVIAIYRCAFVFVGAACDAPRIVIVKRLDGGSGVVLSQGNEIKTIAVWVVIVAIVLICCTMLNDFVCAVAEVIILIGDGFSAVLADGF